MTTTPRLRLGDLLVQASLVTPEQVDEALVRQKETGRRLGETLIELGYVSEQEVAQVLSNQLSVPWANLRHIDFSRELLNLIPADLAEKWVLVPVYLRRIRKTGDTLFVALDDPLNDKALAEVAAHVGKPVQPMVASSTELRAAIRAYYGRELPMPAPPPKRPNSLIPVDIELDDLMSEPTPIEPPAEAPAEAPAAPASEAAAPDASEELLPRKRPKKSGARMITLTLLDGTAVSLPAPGSTDDGEAPADQQLTTRDLVRALMLRGRGENVEDVLGDDVRWESIMAALLALLVKKGLVADWEFVEAFQRARRKKRTNT